MSRPDDPKSTPPPARAPRHGLLVMALILLVMALVAAYSNLQNARRDRIETVTIAPAPSPTPAPSAAASATVP